MLRENEGRTVLLELSFAFMGLIKILGLEAPSFRRLGLSPKQTRRIGAMESVGALMVAHEDTRRIGAAGLAAVSALLLAVEVRDREFGLLLPRLVLTGLAIAAASDAGRDDTSGLGA